MSTLLFNFLWWEDLSPRFMICRDGLVVQSPTAGPAPTDFDGERVDLQGQVLLPKFIDAHCHILPTGLDLQKLSLSSCESHSDVLEAVSKRVESQPEGWIHAVHYEQSRYEGGIHLHRDQLDAISSTRPILLRHVNGHASVANSAALTAAGITEDTPDPEGGTYVRDDSGRMTGVLLEAAHETVTSRAPGPDLQQMVDAIIAAGESMAAYGIGTASDMMTGRFDLLMELEAYRLAAQRGCPIRTRLYLQWKTVFGPRGIGIQKLHEEIAKFDDPDRTKIAGIKIFADGAIGSATAAIYGSYSGAVPNGPIINPRAKSVDSDSAGTTVSGQLMYSPEKLTEMTKIASDAGFQVAIHAIGDYAVDLVLDAFEATGVPSRHRIEHAMLMSDDQIARLKALGSYCTFQPEFLLRFGKAYNLQLGADRAWNLKRARSVINAGIPLSFNSDRPIVSGNPWDAVHGSIKRPPQFNPAENITLIEAINGCTVEGARVNGDEGKLGSLATGELADYQTFSLEEWERQTSLD